MSKDSYIVEVSRKSFVAGEMDCGSFNGFRVLLGIDFLEGVAAELTILDGGAIMVFTGCCLICHGAMKLSNGMDDVIEVRVSG